MSNTVEELIAVLSKYPKDRPLSIRFGTEELAVSNDYLMVEPSKPAGSEPVVIELEKK